MKQFLTILIFCFYSALSFGQTGFHMIPNVANGNGDPGIMDLKIRADVVNETDTTIEVGWERIVMETPDNWLTYICSDITCAPPSASFGTLILPANDTVNLDCHFLPEATVGLGKVILKLFPIPDTSRVILMEYNCAIELTSSTQPPPESEASPLFIFPNPTRSDVTILGTESLKSIEIINSLGQTVMMILDFQNVQHSLSHLPAGQYFLISEELNGNKKESISLLKL